MAWHHVEDCEIVAPVHALVPYVDRHGNPRECIGRTPTGAYVTKELSIFRCGNCRALAVGAKGFEPSGPCLKCKAADK